MTHSVFRKLFGIALCLESVASASGPAPLCGRVVLERGVDPSFTDSERTLVCGDPKSDAWRTIPLTQARYFLGNFLQQRGYHHPTLEERQGWLWVNPGNRSRVTRLNTTNAPALLDPSRLRNVLGEVLAPPLLDRIEKWIRRELQALGYPCPKLTSRGDPDSGVVTVDIETGPLQYFGGVANGRPPDSELDSGIFRRYDTFRPGDPFNGDLLVVSENRVLSENVLEGYHLSAACGDANQAAIHQALVIGPPRLLRAGFGVNTEGILITKAGWKNARLGATASVLDLSATASVREQRFDATMNWYHLPFPSRRSIRPSFRLRHDNEEFFETLEIRTQLAYSTSWDNPSVGLVVNAGPAASAFRNIRGITQGNSGFLSLDSSLTVKSHDFEYYATSPRSGFLLNYWMSLSDRNIAASASAERFGLNGEILWNLNHFDPPLLIVALRGGFSTTVADDSDIAAARIPATFLQYLGGSTTIRGFGRQELPASGIGGRTSLFGDFEFRLSDTLPWSLEPVAFVDAGAIGALAFNLDTPWYWSPGAGLRWQSPVGVFRMTIAHGYPISAPGHWQLYLSFGEEF